MTLAGVHVRSIGEGVMNAMVSRMAVNADTIAASLQEGTQHVVWMFDLTSGDLIRSFGERGDADGQIGYPGGMRFTPDGRHLLMADQRNKRLSLFTLAGAFVRSIGVPVGAIKSPGEVAFASNGDILVAGLHRVCVFSRDGSTLLRSFGSEGVSPGKFSSPHALAVLGDKLFVLDTWPSDGSNNRVHVFN